MSVSNDHQLARLKEILYSKELASLIELKSRVEDVELRKKALSEDLPDAFNAMIASTQVETLHSLIEDALKQSIKNNPKEYADILYPVILPSIRKAVSESMRSVMEKIDRMVKKNMSVSAFKMRLKALQQGIPYADYLLRTASEYSVEELYLIHSSSGLLVQHVYKDTVSKDSDAVSAMLIAIEKFASTSFQADSADESAVIQRMTLGDQMVYIVHGSYALLACVVKGVAPLVFREQLQQVLEEIHLDCGASLKNYRGDKKSIANVRERMKRCLKNVSSHQ